MCMDKNRSGLERMDDEMLLRPYRFTDCPVLAELFYQTVHHVNRRDYDEKQLQAWATGSVDLKQWNASFMRHDTIVAEQQGVITGFGDMDDTGYLDRLYVHKDYQGQGIATAICDALEQHALEQHTPVQTFHTAASITARSFFEKRGYHVVREQQVCRQGVLLTNYVMEKQC